MLRGKIAPEELLDSEAGNNSNDWGRRNYPYNSFVIDCVAEHNEKNKNSTRNIAN